MWHFINLTNGIELLQSLMRDCGVSRSEVSFCRIQSSHCEACDFEAVLREIDHNMLLRLAMGDVVLVHDCSSRDLHWPEPLAAADAEADEEADDSSDDSSDTSSGDVAAPTRGHPRAIWWGVEWVRYALREIWNLESEGGAQGGSERKSKRTWWLRGYNVNSLYREKLRALPKSLRKRLKYYRTVAAAAGTQDVLLYGASRWTAMDGEKEWYAEQLMLAMTENDDEEGEIEIGEEEEEEEEEEEAKTSGSDGPVRPRQRMVHSVDAVHSSYDAVLGELRKMMPTTAGTTVVVPPGSELYCAAEFVGVGRAAL